MKKNLIWILGGDRRPDEVPDAVELWRAMAKGIADGTNGKNDFNGATDYSTTLMTYHCSESSSKWFQNDNWLDFNMWGSYHDNYSKTKAFEQVYDDYNLSPEKPTINGEPSYEDALLNWLDDNCVFTPYDVRQIAYWSVIAGACGHTYGCNAIWQFADSGRSSFQFATKTWKQALFDHGAVQLKYLKNLILSRPFFGRHRENELILDGAGECSNQSLATKGNGYAFIYMPTGVPVTISLNSIAEDSVTAWWYDPRTGNAINIGTFDSKQKKTFSPPGISKELAWLKTGRGCDWVLVLDDKSKGFKAPGVLSNQN